MKKTKLFPLVILSSCLLLFSCNETPSSPIPQKEEADIVRTTFFLNSSATTIYKGSNFTLYPKAYKSLEGLTWFSSNTNIATVSQDGEVTALNVGEVVISAYDSTSAGHCTINVIDYDKTYFVTLSADSFILNVGEEYGVTPTLRTNDLTYDSEFTVTLLSESSTDMVSVVKNEKRFVFKALKSGECTYSFITTYNNEVYGANVSILVN